jgi:NADH-quinone oxidoreductase subunit M
MSIYHLPTLLILIPLAGAILVMALPRDREGLIRGAALGIGLVETAFALVTYAVFDGAIYGVQMEYRRPWIQELGIEYHVGLDGISLFLALLAALLLPIAQLASWREVRVRVKEFSATLLAATAGAIGAFVALDLTMFYISLEVTLLPIFLLVGVWGTEGRIHAAVKFALTNVVGSAFILVAIVYLGVLQTDLEGPRSYAFSHLSQLSLSPGTELWLLAALFLGFALKAALFPFHSWLADVHRHATSAGSIVITGVWLNLGIYGFVRFCVPLFTETLERVDEYVALLAVGAILYGSLLALLESDLPRLLTFATVSQVGLIALGFSTLTAAGVGGGVTHMINRGLAMAGLFALAGILRSKGLEEERGLARSHPKTCAAFLFIILAVIGIPGLNLFVSQISVILGALERNLWYAVGAIFGFLLLAASLLRRYQDLAFGDASSESRDDDLGPREVVLLVPLLLGILWMGLNPQAVNNKMANSIEHVLAHADLKHADGAKAPRGGTP